MAARRAADNVPLASDGWVQFYIRYYCIGFFWRESGMIEPREIFYLICRLIGSLNRESIFMKHKLFYDQLGNPS